MYKKFEMELAGRTLRVDVDRVAKQANGAVLMHYGDTTVLCTATASEKPREGIDFFPLSVEYNERMYAVGKIPGGFNKREGKASENAVLTDRVIDRPMRPLFPKDYRNDVTLENLVLSVDQDCSPELTAMLGAAIATTISDIPFDGPISTTQVGLVDGEFVINPTAEQKAVSDLALTVASTREKVIMIEAGANEVPEQQMIDAIFKAHEVNQEVIKFIDTIVAECGKPKHSYESFAVPEELFAAMKEVVTPEELHHILDTNKKNRGYLNFGDHDIKVEYNLNGNVKSISLLTRKVSEMMIEDFMLKANETVATFARSLQLIFNYRVHPSPNPEIIKQKIEYINSLGFDIKLPKNLNNPFAIQNIMKQLNKTPLSEALNEILLQGMRSAYYSTSNIGHYGLGINALKGEAYCHFTSPIRRVMDLIVHMIIKEIITDEKYFDKENFESFVNEICSWSSSKQRLEDKIEKECIGFRTAQYMQNNIGKTFEGKIAYISKKSIMIITKENVYANIKLRDLSENCRFDPKTRTFNLDDKLYTIGDILPVVVTDVDMNSRKVHFKYKKEVNENTVIGNMTKIRRIRN